LELAQTVKGIKEMDQKELAEALPRLREEALEAEEAFRIAQERVHEANARMAKVPAFVEVHDDHLLVNVKTRDKNFILLELHKTPVRTRGRRGSRSTCRVGGVEGMASPRRQGTGSSVLRGARSPG
jgi:hypothetical protein